LEKVSTANDGEETMGYGSKEKADIAYMANILATVAAYLFYEGAWPLALTVRPDQYDWAMEMFDGGILVIDGHHITICSDDTYDYDGDDT
jgi:hypothetical protein